MCRTSSRWSARSFPTNVFLSFSHAIRRSWKSSCRRQCAPSMMVASQRLISLPLKLKSADSEVLMAVYVDGYRINKLTSSRMDQSKQGGTALVLKFSKPYMVSKIRDGLEDMCFFSQQDSLFHDFNSGLDDARLLATGESDGHHDQHQMNYRRMRTANWRN